MHDWIQLPSGAWLNLAAFTHADPPDRYSKNAQLNAYCDAETLHYHPSTNDDSRAIEQALRDRAERTRRTLAIHDRNLDQAEGATP